MAGAAINAKADDSDAPEQYGNFKRSVALVDLQGSYNQPIKVIKYTSDKTGLKVVLIDLEGMLCRINMAFSRFLQSSIAFLQVHSVICMRLSGPRSSQMPALLTLLSSKRSRRQALAIVAIVAA